MQNVHGRNNENLVVPCINACISQLKELSNRLKDNEGGLSKDALEEFREQIAAIAKDAVSEKFNNSKTLETINDVLTARTASHENSAQEPKELIRVVKQRIDESIRTFDPLKDADYAKVTAILKPAKGAGKGGDDMDEDLVMIEQGLTEATILCPVTFSIFVDPVQK